MSPVARSQRHAGRALLVAGIGVAVAIGLAFTMSVLANRGTVNVNLGDDVFDAGNAEDLAENIAENGPVIYSDVAGGSRDIIVQHVGNGVKDGWHAFDARPPDTSRDCSLQWQPEVQEFREPCSDKTYPADGEGLPQYPVVVTDDGDVEVDLRNN